MKKEKEYEYNGHIPTRVIRETDLEDWNGAPLLNIAELNVTKVQRAKRESDLDPIDYLLYYCEPKNRTTQTCPKCGDANYASHSNSDSNEERRLAHDVSIGMTQVDLFVKVPRYRCKNEECNCTFNHRFISIMENRQMTARLYDYICRKAFPCTFTELALETGYSDKTISNIFDEYCEVLKPHLPQIVAPRVLGIDEVTVLGRRRGVFVDAENGKLLDIKEDNKQDTVIKTIQSMKDYDKNIQIVTMDMSCGYRYHVSLCLPNAKIVVDRFHVIQDLEQKIKKCRTRIIEYLEDQIAKIDDAATKAMKKAALSLLKGDIYMFLYSHEEMESKKEHEQRLENLAIVCSVFPEVDHLRSIKNEFEDIYNCLTREDAKEALNKWADLVPPVGSRKEEEWEQIYDLKPHLFADFRAFRKTVTVNWRKEFLTYFEPNCRVSNAAAEGNNNRIKEICRDGKGYKFTHVWAKAVLVALVPERVRYVAKLKLELVDDPNGITPLAPEALAMVDTDASESAHMAKMCYALASKATEAAVAPYPYSYKAYTYIDIDTDTPFFPYGVFEYPLLIPFMSKEGFNEMQREDARIKKAREYAEIMAKERFLALPLEDE